MTNIKIAYNDIPFRAVLTTASSENTDYPHQNLFGTSKTLHWESASAVTSSTITLDLGVGNTASIDHAILSGLNAILAQTSGTLGVYIRGSTDNFVGSNVVVLSNANVLASDLVGSHNEEFVLEGALSTAYRYWRLHITTANSVIHKLRNLFLGVYFDFSGRSPSYPYSIGLNSNALSKGFVGDANTMFVSSSGRTRREYSLSWKGITDAVREDFYAKIGEYLSDFPFYLVLPTGFTHQILKNKLMYGWGNSSYDSNEKWKNSGYISFTFYEDILG